LLLAKGVLNTEKEVNDFCEARLLIETEVAGLCAERATQQDLKALDRIVREMKAALDSGGDDFGDLDLNFHMAVAEGCKNKILAELLKHIREGLQELIGKSLHLPAGMALAYDQHRVLLDALKQRDPGGARKAMRAHLRAFQRGYAVLFKDSR
jgi:GntR family transcriptional repressor for pyruvate dehydrogenase complex